MIIVYVSVCLCGVLGAFGKVTEGVWKDPTTNIEKKVAIKTLRSELSISNVVFTYTLYTTSRTISLSFRLLFRAATELSIHREPCNAGF